MINIIRNLYTTTRINLPHTLCLLAIATLFSNPLHARFSDEPAPPSQDEQHRRASEQMRQGNYAIAYCIWHPMAENNDSQAQYNIGWMYHNGYGLSIDDESAFFWWIKAAAAGNTDAEYALGDLYLQGQGVEKDLSIALGWYVSAALKGHLAARETLLALLAGDDDEARKLFAILLKSNWSILGNAMQINVDRANTRNGPGKEYKIVSTLERGHVVIPIRQQDGWTEIGITSLGKTAWIFSRLIRPLPGAYSQAGDSLE